MSIRILAFAISLWALVLGAPSVFAQYSACSAGGIAHEDGTCWNTLTHDEKEGIVIGIFVGQKSDLAGSIVNNYRRNWVVVPSATHAPDIVDYFDMLYKIPANRDITWEWASILAAMNARDDSTSDIAALIRFLREHTSIPTSGKIVGVVAPDVITITSDQGQFDVHLEGVTSNGLSDVQRRTATAFLRGISEGVDDFSRSASAVGAAQAPAQNAAPTADMSAAFGLEPTPHADTLAPGGIAGLVSGQPQHAPWEGKLCDRPSHLSVSLNYPRQLFQDGKTLSAVVMFSPFTFIYLKGHNVPSSALAGMPIEEDNYLSDAPT